MHLKSDNIEIMIGSETDEIIEKLFDSLLQRYQERLEDSKKEAILFLILLIHCIIILIK